MSLNELLKMVEERRNNVKEGQISLGNPNHPVNKAFIEGMDEAIAMIRDWVKKK